MKHKQEQGDKFKFEMIDKYAPKFLHFFDKVIKNCKEYAKERGLNESIIDEDTEHIILNLGNTADGERRLFILKSKKVFFEDDEISIDKFIKKQIDKYAAKIIINSKKD